MVAPTWFFASARICGLSRASTAIYKQNTKADERLSTVSADRPRPKDYRSAPQYSAESLEHSLSGGRGTHSVLSGGRGTHSVLSGGRGTHSELEEKAVANLEERVEEVKQRGVREHLDAQPDEPAVGAGANLSPYCTTYREPL